MSARHALFFVWSRQLSRFGYPIIARTLLLIWWKPCVVLCLLRGRNSCRKFFSTEYKLFAESVCWYRPIPRFALCQLLCYLITLFSIIYRRCNMSKLNIANAWCRYWIYFILLPIVEFSKALMQFWLPVGIQLTEVDKYIPKLNLPKYLQFWIQESAKCLTDLFSHNNLLSTYWMHSHGTLWLKKRKPKQTGTRFCELMIIKVHQYIFAIVVCVK